MRDVIRIPKPSQSPGSGVVRRSGALVRPSPEPISIPHAHAEVVDRSVDTEGPAPGLRGVDFSRISLHHPGPGANKPGRISPIDGHETAGLGGLRTRVSRITGIDVGAVPVETGPTGDRRAWTTGGRVILGSSASEHDVAHELAHAAQQRASSGPWLGAGAMERRADEIAAAALAGARGASIPPGRAPFAAIQGAGDPYSREGITLPPPPAGLTAKDLKDQVDLKVKAGDITGYSLSGVKAGEPAEVFLYNALVRLANKDRWGSELDLITTIGAGKGEVTVRFDAKGGAEAQLVGKAGPVVPAAFAKSTDASAALVAKFKLAKVTGEHGKSWTIDELNKVLAAWGRLSAAEAAALEGYTLIRTDKLVQDGEPLQGQTTHSDEVKPKETEVKHRREIRFADSAFADDPRSFIGDAADAAPASFEVLIHEVGHALESKPFDDLNVPAVADAAKFNRSAATAHAAQLTANAAINAAMRGRFPRPDLTAGQPVLDAVSAAQVALQSFETSPDAGNEKSAKQAIADRDAAKSVVAKGNKVVAGLARSIAAQDAYFAACERLLAAKTGADASRAKADALKSGANTKRLQAFIDLVTKEKIRPPTAYAAKHWPAEPAEFFNEAFSLWKNDPVFFGKYSPKLKAWFDGGNHLK